MPLSALRRLSFYTLFLSTSALGLAGCGGSDSPEPPPTASSSAGGGASSSEGEPASSASSESSSSSESSESSSSSSSSTSSADSSASSSEPAPDQTPDAFSFEAHSDVELGATVTSNPVTIQGIDTETPVSISGGQYAINGADFTGATASVENGDQVTVQLTASEAFSTEVSATLTVGGVSGAFTATTLAEDTVPDAFGFAPLEDQPLGESVTSETVTLTGFNTPVSISVTNGEYSLDGESYTAEAAKVSSGSTVTLTALTPEGPGETQEVQLTVGAEHAVWAISTAPDEDAPEGDIAFPPQMSATGADTLTIRGRASDELSGVAEVALTVENDGGTEIYTLEADEETGFAKWQQAVTLVPGDNKVSLQVTDEAGNELADPVEVTVVKQPYEDPFPDDSDRLFGIYDLVLDEAHNRILLIGEDEDPENLGRRLVMAVDLSTGHRSEFVTSEGENESLGIWYLRSAALDPANNRLLVVDRNSLLGSVVYGFDLETGLGTVLMKSESAGDAVSFEGPEAIEASPLDVDSFYVASTYPFRVLKVKPSMDERQVVTDPESGVGEGPDNVSAEQILVTADEKTMYLGAINKLFKVDVETGNRVEIPLDYPTDGPYPIYDGLMLAGEKMDLYLFEIVKGLIKKDAETEEWVEVHPYNDSSSFDARYFSGAHYVEEDDYFYVAQDVHKAVFAYDLVTNEFVIVTRYSE